MTTSSRRPDEVDGARSDERPTSDPSRRRRRPTAGASTQRPTLQTVADAVGVSRTTVSNAYSRPDQLGPALRGRILATAAQLGYSGPNAVARRLRVGRAGAIGLLFTEELSYAFEDPAAVLFLAGVAETLQARDVGLLLVPARPTSAFDEGAVRDAVVDGFLVYSVSDDHPAVAAVLERRLPTVVVDQPTHAGGAFVGIDDEAGAYAAAAHVVELGHRNVAILTDRISSLAPASAVTERRDPSTGFEVARSRLAGYRRAFETVGLTWPSIPVLECFPNSPAVGAEATRRLFAAETPPTAIVAMTDQLALGALMGAVDLGLRVPDALTIVGYDDIPAAATTRPALTTVRQPLRDKGRVAAELLERMDPEHGGERRLLATELVIRGSSAPPDD